MRVKVCRKQYSNVLKMKRSNFTKEEFELAVKNSLSIVETYAKLGFKASGSIYRSFYSKIKHWNVDISHFKGKGWNTGNRFKRFGKLIPIDQILVENSTYIVSNTLKNRLYKEGIKERKCEECGQGEIWRGNKMSLILDHKNGVHDDNRIENLRIVCPNCNATLDTHCGKNRRKNMPS